MPSPRWGEGGSERRSEPGEGGSCTVGTSRGPARRREFRYDVSTMLDVLDKAFLVFHTALVLFNMFGWAWRRTRVLHLVTLGATAFSWFVLGAFYGWGYCLCTDWHFQ